MGGHFHPRFLERLEGELGESSDRCLWPRAAARAVTGAHSQRWGCSEGAATHHRCPGVVLTLIAPGPERGQLRPPRSRSKSSCAERGQGALWALGHAGSFAQWAGHAGNYLLRGVYTRGEGQCDPGIQGGRSRGLCVDLNPSACCVALGSWLYLSAPWSRPLKSGPRKDP